MADRRPSWRGHLRLSLVTCPVALYPATDHSANVHFNLINSKTGHRIHNVVVDAGTDERVARADLIKGFEISKGRYVTLTPDEIEAVKIESAKTIDIDAFVPADEIDRLYWDNPYFMVPDGHLAEETFAVIRSAMEHEGQVALGKVVLASRERLMALEPRGKIIIATTLRAHGEVRDFAGLEPKSRARPPADMISIAAKIMHQKAAHFEPAKFQDRYEDALRALIKRKQKGEVLEIEAEEKPERNVVDLMEALERSLKGGGAAAGARRNSAPRKRAAAHAAKRPARKRAHS